MINRRTFLRLAPLAVGIPAAALASRRIRQIFLQDDNAQICASKFKLAISLGLDRKPINEAIVEMGKSFLGTEYVAHPIETPGEEHLIVNLRGVDCVLFCENSLALARCVKKRTMTYDAFKTELQFIRYRGGEINGYTSRLHYFSDFLADNEKKKVLKDITRSIGGVQYRKHIDFMSRNANSYARLKEHPEFVEIIKQQEVAISKRLTYHILKNNIDRFASNIYSGDIIAITCDVPGLDVAHTGIAIWQHGKLHLMHAPNLGQEAQISKKTLADYLAGNKTQTGIMVARAIEPT